MRLPPVLAVALAACCAVMRSGRAAAAKVEAVEFLPLDPPAPRDTLDERAEVHTWAQARYRYQDGSTRTFPLVYHRLMATGDSAGGRLVGSLYDVHGAPLRDADGPLASDGPDGATLIAVPGMRSSAPGSDALALVTQYEYRSQHIAGGANRSYWSRLPAAMSVATLDQDRSSGALRVARYAPIDFSAVHGDWIHCGATLSPWNTHIGSEEYEPDAKTRIHPGFETREADTTDIACFSAYYFGDSAKANPYHYGLVPEVTVHRDGSASVVKHYATGRYSHEMLEFASDERTAVGGDDGNRTGLFMFVADRPRDLSAGTLYAARIAQEADRSMRVSWIRLGHGTDAEIAARVAGGIDFDRIFEYRPPGEDTTGFRHVETYMGGEWLRLTGDRQTAAFLETRRYAAYVGATTEFSKMEYIAFNPKDRKFYVTISRVEKGMADGVGDIRLAPNAGGMILEMATAKGARDTDGNVIHSDFVGATLVPLVVGDAAVPCDADSISGPDNLCYVDAIRTLFIGEDTGRRVNNCLWAYHIDTRRLTRILSVPAGAEVTGLSIAPDYAGHAYILSNFQHPGEAIATTCSAEVREAIMRRWNGRKRAAIGYIGTASGALPAFSAGRR
jgi:secreted PhoX family phosphatase